MSGLNSLIIITLDQRGYQELMQYDQVPNILDITYETFLYRSYTLLESRLHCSRPWIHDVNGSYFAT